MTNQFLKIKTINLITFFVFSFLLLSVNPYKVDALTISPVRLEVNGDPDQILNEEMTLTNDTDSIQTFYSSFANFEAKGETGSPSFVESKNDLDKWISTVDSVTINPKQSLIIPIQIRIPNNSEPGGHFAAVFWGTTPNTNNNSSVSIGAKVGMLILLSVSGDVKENGGLVEFSTIDNKFFYNTLPVSFFYRFKNDGDDRIKPNGFSSIRNTIFIPVKKIDANLSQGNVLPNSIRKFEFDWVKNPRSKDFIASDKIFARFFDTVFYQFRNFAFGIYSAHLDLTYGSQGIHTSKNIYFFVFPWQMLICLVIVISFILWGGSKLVKKYNRYIIQKARDGMILPSDANNA